MIGNSVVSNPFRPAAAMLLAIAMLAVGACLVAEADGGDADAASVERGGSAIVPMSALFSPSQISQLAEGDEWVGGGATPSIYTMWNSGSISIEPDGSGNAKITASSQVKPGSHLVTIYGFEGGMDHQLFTVPVEVTGTTGHTPSSALDSVDFVLGSYPASGDPTALHSPVHVREGAHVSYRLCMQSYDPVAYLTAAGSSAHQPSIGGLSVSLSPAHDAVLAGTMGSEEVTLHVVYGARNYRVTFAPVITPLTPIQILSTGGTSATVGSEYIYRVQTEPADATIDISGADWLHVTDHTVSGTPTAVGSSVLHITASKAGHASAAQDVVIVVTAAPAGSPVIDALTYTIDPADAYRVTLTAQVQNAASVLFDFGDGTQGTGLSVVHTYARSGTYTVIATAGTAPNVFTKSVSVGIYDKAPITTAYYNQPYTYSLGIDTSAGGSATVTGAPFLTAAVGSGVITVSGTPASTAYVGQTYPVTLTYGSFSQSWSLTVVQGVSAPHAGFTLETDGLKVTVTSTATNASSLAYQWAAGEAFVPAATSVTEHTYPAPGTYVITQRATNSASGSTYTDDFSATVTLETASAEPEDEVRWFAVALIAAGIIAILASLYRMNVPLAVCGAAAAAAGLIWQFLP